MKKRLVVLVNVPLILAFLSMGCAEGTIGVDAGISDGTDGDNPESISEDSFENLFQDEDSNTEYVSQDGDSNTENVSQDEDSTSENLPQDSDSNCLTNCAQVSKNCGTISDNCGGTLNCGACTVTGEICGGGGIANVCAAGTCTPPTCIIYYVDSSLGSDGNSCALAQDPSTPKKTVSGILSCDLGPGAIIRFRGEFDETIYPTRSGTVIYEVQDINEVNGSVVTFAHAITEVYPLTDYVTIYGSRKGNSGAFMVVSASDGAVTVDTSDLPAGQFIPETASDPGNLQAAILRPVHFTAWDKNQPPVFAGCYQAYRAFNIRVIMVSYWKSIAGHAINPSPECYVWPAVEIDGDNGGNSDFQIFDHLEITNAESGIAIESTYFQSNYDIVQHNYIHDTGAAGNAIDDAVIYWGRWGMATWHHDFVQIMYNRIGPHVPDSSIGDGIDTKQSTHGFTIFGNEVFGLNSNSCGDAPIKTEATDGFIANNYVHDIYSRTTESCGISIVDVETSDSASGADRIIVANNIVANVRGVGISLVDANNIQILNNTVYNIPLDPNCTGDCMELWMGIRLHNWNGPMTNVTIKNNIVQTSHIGIGRYTGSHDEFPVSIDSDYNIVFNTDIPFRGTITQNTNDRVTDPGLVAPQNGNFGLGTNSSSRDSGTDLSSVFCIDNHDAADPTLPAITAPDIRTGVWDVGVYESRPQ